MELKARAAAIYPCAVGINLSANAGPPPRALPGAAALLHILLYLDCSTTSGYPELYDGPQLYRVARRNAQFAG